MIGFRQGKTVKFEINVVDTAGTPVSLLGAKAVFAYKSIDEEDADAVCAECTIVDSKITYVLTSTVTAELLGKYDIEIKLKDSVDYVDPIYTDVMQVKESIIPTCDLLV